MALLRSAQRSQSYRTRDRTPGQRRLRRLVLFLAVLFIAHSIVSAFLLGSVRVDSNSMLPTLAAGQRLFTTPLVLGPRLRAFSFIVPGIRTPQRCDLVALRPPYQDESNTIVRLLDPVVRFVTLQRHRISDGKGWRSSLQIKRIIGLPGDTVRLERFVAYVKPSGESAYAHEFQLSLVEYGLVTDGRPDGWLGDDPFGGAMAEVTLGDDEYFVLGDNRTAAIDSRHWGVVSSLDIHALVVFRYWPLRAVGRVK